MVSEQHLSYGGQPSQAGLTPVTTLHGVVGGTSINAVQSDNCNADRRKARRERMLKRAARRAWLNMPHPAAQGQDESGEDCRKRCNIQKRLRRLQHHVVWAGNIKRAKEDHRRSRTRRRGIEKQLRIIHGREASAANRKRQAEEKARREAVNARHD